MKISIDDKAARSDLEASKELFAERYALLVGYVSVHREELKIDKEDDIAVEEIMACLDDYIKIKKFLDRLGIEYENDS